MAKASSVPAAILRAQRCRQSGWSLTRPPQMLETSLPGVFAVGDVRSGNVKRVASAVGEGSMAISLVHRALGRIVKAAGESRAERNFRR